MLCLALSAEWPQWPATLRSGVYRWASPQLHRPVPRQHPHHCQRQRSRWGFFGLLICPTRGLFLVNIFLSFFFNNNNYYFYFLFGLLVELPVDQSSWKRICTFPPWQLCSLNFNYTVCWKFFWRAHHSLNELYRLFISIRSSPKVVLSPWERKTRVTAAIDSCSRS